MTADFHGWQPFLLDNFCVTVVFGFLFAPAILCLLEWKRRRDNDIRS